jgi:hypothetical protein
MRVSPRLARTYQRARLAGAAARADATFKQREVLTEHIVAEDIPTDDANAYYGLTQFCAPDGTGTRHDSDEAIAGALQ